MSIYGNPNAPSEQQRRDMAANLERLQSLQKHPGWLLLVEYLDEQTKEALRTMSNTKELTSELALKATITFTLLSKFKNLPKEYEESLLGWLAPQKK